MARLGPGGVDLLSGRPGLARRAHGRARVRRGGRGGPLAVEVRPARRRRPRRLDLALAALESKGLRLDGWATPGANPAALAFDRARVAARRAERRLAALPAGGRTAAPARPPVDEPALGRPVAPRQGGRVGGRLELEIPPGRASLPPCPSPLVVLVLAAGWRVFVLYVPALSNFSPVMALAFCAGAYTRNRWMCLAPFAALVVSDLYIDRYYATVYHYEWSTAGGALRIALLRRGARDRGPGLARRNWLNLMGGALAGSVLFYLVTNTASWFGDPAYAQDAAGWWQALTVGQPQYYPDALLLPEHARERPPLHGVLRPRDGVRLAAQGRSQPPRPKAGRPLAPRASSARPSSA
jgi:hypothetical protein